MKFNGKILSVFALLVATSACYGGDELTPEVVSFRITNNATTTIYGSIYNTTASGALVGDDKANIQFMEVQQRECFSLDFNKSLNRKSEFTRLIFATNKWALRQKLENNVTHSKVNSTIIPQNLFKKEHRRHCYTITGSEAKLRIKHTSSGDKCSNCVSPSINSNSHALQSISSVNQTREDLESAKPTWRQKLQAKFKRKPTSEQQLTVGKKELQSSQPLTPEDEQEYSATTMHFDGSGSMKTLYDEL